MRIFFNILIGYVLCSFLTLGILLSGYIKMIDKDTDEEIPIKPATKVALAIYFPVFIYILIKSYKGVE